MSLSYLEDIRQLKRNKYNIKHEIPFGITTLDSNGEIVQCNWVQYKGLTNVPIDNAFPLPSLVGDKFTATTNQKVKLINSYIEKHYPDIKSNKEKLAIKISELIDQFDDFINEMVHKGVDISFAILARYKFVIIDLLEENILNEITELYNIELEYNWYKHIIINHILNHPSLINRYKMMGVLHPPKFVFSDTDTDNPKDNKSNKEEIFKALGLL